MMIFLSYRTVTRSLIPKCFRSFGTTAALQGRRNFRKFPIPNKRGIFEHRKLPRELLENEYDYPVAVDGMGIRYPGVWFGKRFVYVREMEPELIVPTDLDQPSNLKPYVSYRTTEITQTEFTAQDLFNVTYGKEIVKDFRDGKEISVERNPEMEQEAKNRALKTGSDLFYHQSFFGKIEPSSS